MKSYLSYLPFLKENEKDKLDIFFTKLCEEAIPRGFIGKSDQEKLWLRHILDSLLIFNKKINFGNSITDLGSGAGLPGIVLAIIKPEITISLIDFSRKKINFLINLKRDLKLHNVKVLASNADQDCSKKSDTVVFRAFQKPIVSLELALNHLKMGGQIIYWRSKSFMNEKCSEINQKIMHRLRQLGLTVIDHIMFRTPEELGDRGIYLFLKDRKTAYGFPRPFHKILSDPLNQILKEKSMINKSSLF